MFVFCKDKIKTANLICDKPNKCAGEINWGKNTKSSRLDWVSVAAAMLLPAPDDSI